MRRVLIGIPLVIAAVAGVLAVLAPNPYPLVLVTLCGLISAQAASECCPRGQYSFRWFLLQHKIAWLKLRRRLAGTIRNR